MCFSECLRFGLVGAASIASSNISLLVNKVGLYQVIGLVIYLTDLDLDS